MSSSVLLPNRPPPTPPPATLRAVCSIWAASLVGTSVLFNYAPDWKKQLFLHWPSVWRKKEYFRLATNFGAFGGKFDFSSMIDLFFLCQSGTRIEAKRSLRPVPRPAPDLAARGNSLIIIIKAPSPRCALMLSTP